MSIVRKASQISECQFKNVTNLSLDRRKTKIKTKKFYFKIL